MTMYIYMPYPLNIIVSWILLHHIPDADWYLILASFLLLILTFVRLHAFSRPPPVPLKSLPRRPALHVLFTPDDPTTAVVQQKQQQQNQTTGGRKQQQQQQQRWRHRSPYLEEMMEASSTVRTKRTSKNTITTTLHGSNPPTSKTTTTTTGTSTTNPNHHHHKRSNKNDIEKDLNYDNNIQNTNNNHHHQDQSMPPLSERIRRNVIQFSSPLQGISNIHHNHRYHHDDYDDHYYDDDDDNNESDQYYRYYDDEEEEEGFHEETLPYPTTSSSSTTTPTPPGQENETNVKTEVPFQEFSDLPDSFAPLLSSSQMEILKTHLTTDLIHAVHVEGGVRVREGRHEIPLDKDSSRPQLVLNVGKDGCRIMAMAVIGSDGFSSSEDLDVTKPTPTRSCPMVKRAGVVLDPPLPLLNVAPTLIHFPTLFEDNVVPTLRRIQIVRYLLDFFMSMTSFLERILWIFESKCRIHLSKVSVTPQYKGATKGTNTPQWCLTLSFSGHVLLFGWIPVPFIGVVLPSFIIPKPHALLENLLTPEPLASAKLKRENIAEERIVMAILDTMESYNVDVKAVATPPALGMDLTFPGGLTVAVEMMHGKDVHAGMRRQEANMDGTIPESYSGETLSSWGDTTNHNNHGNVRQRRAAIPTTPRSTSVKQQQQQQQQGPPPFDANELIPWFLDVSLKGRLEKDRVSVLVTKVIANHTDITDATRSHFGLSGNIVIWKANDNSNNSNNINNNNSLSVNESEDSPSVCSLLLFPKQSSSVNPIPPSPQGGHYHRLLQKQLLKYDYAFAVADDTQLDAISIAVGASHPMLEGGTIITTVLESIYAFGSLMARDGAILDPTEKRRKRNILKHLPAVDFTAGIQNAFIPEESMSLYDDGQTKCAPEIQGARVMIRIVGGFEEEEEEDDDHTEGGEDDDATPTTTTTMTISSSSRHTTASFNNGLKRRNGKGGVNVPSSSSSFRVAEGIKVITDFGISSFVLHNESNVNEFPEFDIFEGSRLFWLLSGNFTGRIATHLRPQQIATNDSSPIAPNAMNPLEAYEIDFSGSSTTLKIKESSTTLGHRRIILPTETTIAVNIIESVVDMGFEGQTEGNFSWDFMGSSPILQVASVGFSPLNASHENREQASLLISALRQGRLNFHVSSVGGIAITQAATSRENREGLYDWKFFNALVSPDEESPKRLMQVLHDKRTMHKLLQIAKLVNADLERIINHALTQVWRAKEIFDQEGVSDPGKAIPGHKMARLISLFLCGDTSEVNEILPIIRRVTSGGGLDVVKVKELLRKHIDAYDEWAPEMDRIVRWADMMFGPMLAVHSYVEGEAWPLCEIRSYKNRFRDVPSAKEIYDTLLDKQQLPLDPSFSNLISRIAPYMSFRQAEYVLTVRPATHWQPSDLRRLRYVYSVKKKALEISENYGGISFLPQSFLVSVFLGEATRASLRASSSRGGGSGKTNINKRGPMKQQRVPWPASAMSRRSSTLTTLRRRRATAPHTDLHGLAKNRQNEDEEALSPAARAASGVDLSKFGTSAYRNESFVASSIDEESFSRRGDGREGSSGETYRLGDCLLGPQDVAILLQAGLTSSMKGSTVVQLNQRMLLDLMASQPRSFVVAVLAELGTPGGQGSPRVLTSGLMALLDLDQSSFTEFHRLDMHALLEFWLPGLKIPRREDYLAGGRWARQSYYEAVFGVSKSILEDAEAYMALKGHVQRVRHHVETDPIPLPKELEDQVVDNNIGIDIDIDQGAFENVSSTLAQMIALAKQKISNADEKGSKALTELLKSKKDVHESKVALDAVSRYREAFDACSEVLRLDKLAFQTDWFKSFFNRNYEALMVKSVYDNVMDDTDKVRMWLDSLRNGSRRLRREAALHAQVSNPGGKFANEFLEIFKGSSSEGSDDRVASSSGYFANPTKIPQQELLDAIIDELYLNENERETIRTDPLVRLIISNSEGNYDFTIVAAMGVITEGRKGSELSTAFKRLEEQRGVRTIRADTGTARSVEYNASKIEEAIVAAGEEKHPFGLLGYSQGCANALTAETLLLSGTPKQQEVLKSPNGGLVCRHLLFSAANGSLHGPASDTKVQRLIVMCEEFFKYQQGYFSRAFSLTVLELLNSFMDSAQFQKLNGGAQSFLPDGCKSFWREAQHLPYVPTTTMRGVLEDHTTPESLDMISNLLTKQSGSALHDSQVHVYDAVGHPVYTKNRNGKVLENCDIGCAVQRTHHWSPLCEEVEFLKTKRDEEQASFECSKDRHVFPWVDVNVRFGIIKYV